MTRRTATWLLIGAVAAFTAAAVSAAGAEPAPTREQAIRQTLAEIRKELDAHGGSWEKWGESLKGYRDDIRPCVTDWKTYKWPWPANKGYVFQGAAISLHLRDELEDLPKGERPLESIVHFNRQLNNVVDYNCIESLCGDAEFVGNRETCSPFTVIYG